MKTKIAILLSGLIVLTNVGHTKTIDVRMQNNGPDGIMVFEPGFVEASKGDTVKFIPTDSGHDTVAISVPKGASKWKGKVGETIQVKMTHEGVYLYECKTHEAMAMVGVIQVGKPTNIETVKKESEKLSTIFAMNKDRLTKYLAKVKN